MLSQLQTVRNALKEKNRMLREGWAVRDLSGEIMFNALRVRTSQCGDKSGREGPEAGRSTSGRCQWGLRGEEVRTRTQQRVDWGRGQGARRGPCCSPGSERDDGRLNLEDHRGDGGQGRFQMCFGGRTALLLG